MTITNKEDCKAPVENRVECFEEFNFDGESNSVDDSTNLIPGVYYPKNKIPQQHSTIRQGSRTQTRRCVFKNGEINIDKFIWNDGGFFTKWFITMVEARWRWTLLHFFLAFTIDWLFFAFIYWIIAITHGDLIEEHLPLNQNESNWTPCVNNIHGFTSTFLFSIEVHTTVAYGKRTITLNCPDAITAMCFQCIVSSIFQSFMIGILFAKLTRPKSRTQTILFSRQSVVSLRDGTLCMIFRVGDMRKARLLNIKLSAYMLRSGLDDSRRENFEQTELNIEMDGCDSTFFLWPICGIHVIDKKSPLYNVSAADLLVKKIEIIAVFEGFIESTGQQVQAITSYTGHDILWGQRFKSMVRRDYDKDVYNVDFSKLCDTEKVDTPLCSANEFSSLLSLLDMNTYL